MSGKENGDTSAYADSGFMQVGLTKRELFAAMAMQGLCADPEYDGVSEQYAELSVEFADALLAELAKDQPKKCCDDVRNVVDESGNNVTSVMLVTAIYGAPPIQRWQWQSGSIIWSPEFASRQEALDYANAGKLAPMPKEKTE